MVALGGCGLRIEVEEVDTGEMGHISGRVGRDDMICRTLMTSTHSSPERMKGYPASGVVGRRKEMIGSVRDEILMAFTTLEPSTRNMAVRNTRLRFLERYKACTIQLDSLELVKWPAYGKRHDVRGIDCSLGDTRQYSSRSPNAETSKESVEVIREGGRRGRGGGEEEEERKVLGKRE